MIYLIEDDSAVRDSLMALLEAEGYRVMPFESGDAFLAAIDKKRVGCALVDVHMPGVDGLELLEKLGRSGIALPMILMTGRLTPEIRARADRLGAIALLEKPLDPGSLLATLARTQCVSVRT